MGGKPEGLDVFELSDYNHPIKGSIEEGRPLGGAIHGGVFVAPEATLSVEVSFRAANTGRITERVIFHTTTDELSSRYSDRAILTSILLGGRVGDGTAIAGHLVAGLTILTRTHALTDRAGIGFYPGGQAPIQYPDLTARATRFGFGGGADVLTAVGAAVSAAWSARIHWTGTLTVQLGAGLRWGR